MRALFHRERLPDSMVTEVDHLRKPASQFCSSCPVSCQLYRSWQVINQEFFPQTVSANDLSLQTKAPNHNNLDGWARNSYWMIGQRNLDDWARNSYSLIDDELPNGPEAMTIYLLGS